jgi:hypothetical protein
MFATDEGVGTTEAESSNGFVPPYISFAQLENVLERMRNEGVPARVDRSYLGSWSGSAQGQFLTAARSLDLLDDFGRPTEVLKTLVQEPDMRPAVIGDLLRQKYPGAVMLGESATQQQLEEVFREYPGISGSTTRKAITFYLHAAKFAGIPLSPFFKVGRATPGNTSQRTGRARAPRRAQPASEPAPPSQTNPLSGLHPAIATLVQALPSSTAPTAKAEFSMAEREAWFAYAQATFNLIYSLPEGDDGPGPSSA